MRGAVACGSSATPSTSCSNTLRAALWSRRRRGPHELLPLASDHLRRGRYRLGHRDHRADGAAGGRFRLPDRRALHRSRRRTAAPPLPPQALGHTRSNLPHVARKITGLQRVLDAPALFSIAYGEVASSIYIALGIIALHALGLTPEVLALVGALFIVVALSYAEGTAAIPETGGAATFVRRAFNDLLGFLTGWVLFLDYLIVIALSTLFLPHYLGTALGVDDLRESPWDVVIAVCVILAITGVRLVRRPELHVGGIVVAGLDLATQVLLVIVGLALLYEPGLLTQELSLGTTPEWDDIAFALPLAMLAYTGLETV